MDKKKISADEIDDVMDDLPMEPETAEEKEPLAAPIMEEKDDNMLDIAGDVPVQVVAVLGKKNVTVKDLALLKIGEVIELGRPANELVDLVIGGKLIAKAELVDIEGKLGARIVKMIK